MNTTPKPTQKPKTKALARTMQAALETRALESMAEAARRAHASLRLRHMPRVFRSPEVAFRFAAGITGMTVMLGEWPAYWVVCLADAQRLERAGYEWASRPVGR